jgi:DNA (cytosine-5)-methyltransferase 1
MVGLFAGIGGLEKGLHRAGHETLALCEIEPTARLVLAKRFEGIPIVEDATKYAKLPKGAQMITAGFPCQDLSQAGKTLGIRGSQSALVGEVFRLLRTHDVPWVLLENVSFMLRLARGEAMDVLVRNLEELKYKWAYRVVDSRSFGLPQRRERVFLVATREGDPRDVLLSDDAGPPIETSQGIGDVACGFYWTEGTRGLGWAVDATPTLKGGSTLGIPSPPAIVLTDETIVTPGIQNAERLQGFPGGWTSPAESGSSRSSRWKLVGNAVTVDAAAWIGKKLRQPKKYHAALDTPLRKTVWPDAAYNVGEGRFIAEVSRWPVRMKYQHLEDLLALDDVYPLSLRAISGFLSRFESGNLRSPSRFMEALRRHKRHMEGKPAKKAG